MISKLKYIENSLSKKNSSLKFAVAILALFLVAMGCVFSDEPTPVPVSSAPPSSDYLVYTAPAYNITLTAGQSVPGTGLKYINRANDVYNVTIDGQSLTRQGGDSLPWQGVIAPGVFAKYNMRITPSFGIDGLIAAGPVELDILNPVPTEIASLPATIGNAYAFSGVVIGTSVGVGETVPGTTLVYAGETDQGAAFTGTAQYPFRALADSLIWLGQLRDNVYVRQNLRVIAFNANSITLGGTAEIWVVPVP